MFVSKTQLETATYLASQGYVFLRCNSHRARERLIGRGSDVQGFWGWDIRSHGIYAATPDELERARKIPGVTQFRGSIAALGLCVTY